MSDRLAPFRRRPDEEGANGDRPASAAPQEHAAIIASSDRLRPEQHWLTGNLGLFLRLILKLEPVLRRFLPKQLLPRRFRFDRLVAADNHGSETHGTQKQEGTHDKAHRRLQPNTDIVSESAAVSTVARSRLKARGRLSRNTF